jgi:hypothetical protein
LIFSLGCRQFNAQVLEDVFVLGQLCGHLHNPRHLREGRGDSDGGAARAPRERRNRVILSLLSIQIRLSARRCMGGGSKRASYNRIVIHPEAAADVGF